MILYRLLKDGRLRVVPVGQYDQIELTERSENALRGFRHEILDVIQALDEQTVPEWLEQGLDGNNP